MIQLNINLLMCAQIMYADSANMVFITITTYNQYKLKHHI